SEKYIQTVVHDFVPGFDTYTEKLGYLVKANKAFKDVNPEEYVALVIPGGRAPEYIRNDPDLQRIVKHFFNENKPVAQICHAPLILSAVDVLRNRKSTAYPALKKDVETAGAIFEDSAVVIDGSMISARAWPDHPYWMREFMKLLKAKYPP
ncbi:MAG: DJ-1/PfpI family protein, partial [Thermoplasmata archaeon]